MGCLEVYVETQRVEHWGLIDDSGLRTTWQCLVEN